MGNIINDLTLYLRELNTVSIVVRLTLATICAGILGAERGRKIGQQDLELIFWYVLVQL